MITDHVQRWRNRLAIFAAAERDPIDTSAYEVAPIDASPSP